MVSLINTGLNYIIYSYYSFIVKVFFFIDIDSKYQYYHLIFEEQDVKMITISEKLLKILSNVIKFKTKKECFKFKITSKIPLNFINISNINVDVLEAPCVKLNDINVVNVFQCNKLHMKNSSINLYLKRNDKVFELKNNFNKIFTNGKNYFTLYDNLDITLFEMINSYCYVNLFELFYNFPIQIKSLELIGLYGDKVYQCKNIQLNKFIINGFQIIDNVYYYCFSNVEKIKNIIIKFVNYVNIYKIYPKHNLELSSHYIYKCLKHCGEEHYLYPKTEKIEQYNCSNNIIELTEDNMCNTIIITKDRITLNVNVSLVYINY